MKHYLVTLPLGEVNMHCYVMNNDPDIVQKAAARLVHVAESIGDPVVVPMVLATKLSETGIARVRKIVGKISPQAKKLMREATDFHLTMWHTTRGHEPDADLMAMH